MHGHIARLERRVVDRDAGMTTAAGAGDRDVQAWAFVISDRPQRRRAAMAEHRTVATREHRRQPARLAPRRAMPDGVDARVQTVQAPGHEPPFDRAPPASARNTSMCM
jgi:hypothetical protein